MRRLRSMIRGRALPVSSVTDTQTPAPAAAGFADVRRTQPIPVAGIITNKTTRTNPPSPASANKPAFYPIIGDDPVSVVRELSEPARTPTTADPPARYIESPRARHARLYGRQPDIGGSAPWQGVRMAVGTRPGGVPRLPRGLLHGDTLPLPADLMTQGTSARGIRLAISKVRRELKPQVILRPGLGGLDYAMGPRVVPDTPSGVREMIRDVRKKTLYGALIGHRTAPAPVVQRLAFARMIAKGTAQAPVSMSVPNEAPAGNISNPPIAVAPVTGTRMAGSESFATSITQARQSIASTVESQAPTDTTPSSGPSPLLLVAAAVAVLFLVR